LLEAFYGGLLHDRREEVCDDFDISTLKQLKPDNISLQHQLDVLPVVLLVTPYSSPLSERREKKLVRT